MVAVLWTLNVPFEVSDGSFMVSEISIKICKCTIMFVAC
jgi:hypothetical protein